MPTGERVPATLMDQARVRRVLESGELTVNGRMVDASNATLACDASLDGMSIACVYKPVRGERPLWDFPTDTLSLRELAAYAVDEFLGWDCVPLTVWRESGPFGAGMAQLWIEQDPARSVVDIVPAGRIPRGWLGVLDASDAGGRPVSLVHADRPDLRRIALLDAIINNADRKGGHVLVDADDRLWAIDHGVTFSAEPKLRTVLWGWAGRPIDSDLADLERLRVAAPSIPELAFLEEWEMEALIERIEGLRRNPVLPEADGSWPSVPWPVF